MKKILLSTLILATFLILQVRINAQTKDGATSLTEPFEPGVSQSPFRVEINAKIFNLSSGNWSYFSATNDVNKIKI